MEASILWRKAAGVSALGAAAAAAASLICARPDVAWGALLGCALGCADLYLLAADIDRIGAPPANADAESDAARFSRTRRATQSLLVGRSMVRFLSTGAGLALAALVPAISLPAAGAAVIGVRVVLVAVGGLDAAGYRT